MVFDRDLNSKVGRGVEIFLNTAMVEYCAVREGVLVGSVVDAVVSAPIESWLPVSAMTSRRTCSFMTVGIVCTMT